MSYSTARPAPSKQVSLRRETFTTSRLLDYFSEKELTLQSGHDRECWPDVLLKELVDNALDAAEGANVAPAIQLAWSPDGLTVTDNGPGIAPEIVGRILDFSTKTSSKDFYLSPTRGAQGNALKTVLAIPYVLSGNVSSRLAIESRGILHDIDVTVNRIKQEPVVSHTQNPSDVKIGTVVRVSSSCFVDVEDRILQRLADYRLLNPHVAIGKHAPGNVAWVKWRPSDPISPHWYEPEQFTGLIAAYLSAEQDGAPVRHVRDFIANFRGLSSTARQKEILSTLKLTGAKLSALATNGDVNRELAAALLNAMKAASRAIKPQALGIIGEEHIRREFLARECNEASIRYKKSVGVDSHARPYVIEAAFGVFEDADAQRMVVTGLNFSPCIADPFKELTRWESLSAKLAGNYVSQDSLCLVLVHLTAPHLQYADRGKSSVQLPAEVAAAVAASVNSVSGEYAKIARTRIRDANRGERAMDRYRASVRQKRSIKDIVSEHLPAVYLAVSGNNRYPAVVRQIFYGLRPLVLSELTDKGDLDSVYITQTLIPNFMEENPETCQDWDVVFDARGHFAEPHTDKTFGIGTLEVREYLALESKTVSQLTAAEAHCSIEFPTFGPRSRFNNVLFIEKEGFLPLLEKAKIATRFDLGIMSTKGLSSTAARRLMESMPGVRFLTLHDFDKAGFSIVGTLQRDTRRYQFENPPEIIDLGLRLADVRRLKLATEPFPIKPEAAENLEENGATEAEIKFLLGDGQGRRVELNAMTSPQFITWLVGKLKQHGVKKFVPDVDVLEVAFKRASMAHKLNDEIGKVFPKLRKQAEKAVVPRDLAKRVQARLKQYPALSWDAVVSQLAITERIST
jgi:DNA topoisomerase VI subunit B